MQKQEHTPGPWVASWDYKRLSPDSSRVIAHAVGPQHTCEGVPIEWDSPRFIQPNRATMAKVEADARLIAAAPDFLSILKSIVAIDAKGQLMDDDCGPPGGDACPCQTEELIGLMSAARASIAKATGATLPDTPRGGT